MLLVRRDGSMLIDLRRYGGNWTTEIVQPDGTASTVLSGANSEAAEADDGTVVVLRGGGPAVDRIRPDGTVDRIAGPAEGQPDLPFIHHNERIAISADAQRVAVAGGGATGLVVKAFDIGGPVEQVWSEDGVVKPTVCYATPGGLALGPGALFVGCGGPIVKFGAAAEGGTRVAGRNFQRGWVDAPDGTPIERAYLGRVQDSATGPAGQLAMGTNGGVYTISGSTLTRLLPGAPANERDPDSWDYWAMESYNQHAVDLEYDNAGALYALRRDHGTDKSGWLLQRRRTDGTVEVLGGGGTKTIAAGLTGTAVLLGEGRMTAAADGATVYVSQRQPNVVWALNVAKRTWTKVVGGGTTVFRDEVPATSTSLGTVAWLGRDGVDGSLLVGDDSLHRLGADGMLHTVFSGTGPSWASTADGSVYSVDTFPESDPYTHQPLPIPVWRRAADNTLTTAFGSGATGAGAAELKQPHIAAAGANAILVVDQVGPSSVVRRVVPPAATPWVGPAPSMTVTPVVDGDRRWLQVQVTVPPDAQPWRIVARMAYLPARPGPDSGPVVVDETMPAAGGTKTFQVGGPNWWRVSDFQNLRAGHKYGLAMFATTENANPPAVATTVDIPGFPSVLASSGASATTVDFQTDVEFSAVLRDGRDGTPLKSQPVALQTRTVGTSTWTTLETATSGSNGVVRVRYFRPTWRTEARWVFAGAGTMAPVAGGTMPIDVRPSLNLCCSISSLKLGTSKSFGAFLNQEKKGQVLQLQQYLDGKWSKISSCTTDATGYCKLTIKPKKTGTMSYRLYRSGDNLLVSGKSATVKVKVVK
ncbi:MAG: hypothetical protein ACT4QG_08225 [Sporichthyaceae bacterium]